MEASIRNALGDIGNRIGLANAQLVVPSKEILNAKNVKFATTKTTTTVGAAVKMREEKMVTVEEEEIVDEKRQLLNTSCAMIDDDAGGDGDGEEHIEIDSCDDDDDDEEDEDVMYSDEDEDEIGGSDLGDDVNDDEEDDDAILDIDALDAEDPQLCSHFVRQIYMYLTHMEQKYRVMPNFLDKKSVTSRMRSVLVDWLIQVHMKFQLLQETMYLTVYLIDAYLQRQDVSKLQLQLVGVTAMFLASKYEEMYVPAIDDFVYMTDNTYTKSDIRKMEVSMCKTLEFGFGKPLPLHFLRRYSKAGQADPKQHTLAKYFMELSLHDAEFSSVDPSLLAAASLNLSLQLLNGPKWNKNLEYYSGYKAGDLVDVMAKLASLTLKANDLNYKYRAATNKYGMSKFMRISLMPELSGTYMRELAATVNSNTHQ